MQQLQVHPRDKAGTIFKSCIALELRGADKRGVHRRAAAGSQGSEVDCEALRIVIAI